MRSIALLFVVPVLGACAGMPQLTAEQRAYCESMAADMSLQPMHDHEQMKGVGTNPMNMTHDRCRRILAETSTR